MPATQGVPNPRPIKTSDLKSRIMNVATPNNYLLRFAPPQAVQNFMSQRGEAYSTIGSDIELRVISTTTPGTSFLTHSVANDFPGVVEEIPYRRAYESSIAMTLMVDNNYDTQVFFENWIDFMSGVGDNLTASRDDYKNAAAVNYRMNFYGGPSGYKTNIYLTKFEKDVAEFGNIRSSRSNVPGLRYTLIDAYPKQINSMELNYGPTTDFLRLSVVFGYSRYVSERVKIQ